ncbi:uncharacterized protein SCDLUD_004270 [Saccharomycodes ludwigii]|uniref:uncharacterized protein n=1 Tax=Saccharomycodes ludwigii TaxID=36035 RepID=UPI001E8C6FDD|nr:hypothetical protein SCDLUD_004270 [Saccharomycodes ludwigii]KAH3899954.1 hypothetical protein SCDLUD_004270 [Saccharomycodes ludwigii]
MVMYTQKKNENTTSLTIDFVLFLVKKINSTVAFEPDLLLKSKKNLENEEYYLPININDDLKKIDGCLPKEVVKELSTLADDINITGMNVYKKRKLTYSEYNNLENITMCCLYTAYYYLIHFNENFQSTIDLSALSKEKTLFSTKHYFPRVFKCLVNITYKEYQWVCYKVIQENYNNLSTIIRTIKDHFVTNKIEFETWRKVAIDFINKAESPNGIFLEGSFTQVTRKGKLNNISNEERKARRRNIEVKKKILYLKIQKLKIADSNDFLSNIDNISCDSDSIETDAYSNDNSNPVFDSVEQINYQGSNHPSFSNDFFAEDSIIRTPDDPYVIDTISFQESYQSFCFNASAQNSMEKIAKMAKKIKNFDIDKKDLGL